MTKPQLTYPIRAVSRMTGVGIDTLRAWERRHQAVVPARDDRGRVYSDADVARIRLLRDAVAAGHPIGVAAQMSQAQLEAAASGLPSPSAAADVRRGGAFDVQTVFEALDRYDATEVERALSRAAALLPAPELLRDVIVPLLTEVGDRWHSGRAGVAQEHLLSAIVRNVLGSLMRVYARSSAPKRLLFATPSGEHHEFGTLGAALLAAIGGLSAVYFGADMPGGDVASVANTTDIDVVVLGLSNTGDTEAVAREVQRIAASLKSEVELWLGGPGAPRVAALLGGRALLVATYEALEPQLVRLGARF